MSKGINLFECASCLPAVLLRLTLRGRHFLTGFEGSGRETVCVGERFIGVKQLTGLIALMGGFCLASVILLNSWHHRRAECYSLH